MEKEGGSVGERRKGASTVSTGGCRGLESVQRAPDLGGVAGSGSGGAIGCGEKQKNHPESGGQRWRGVRFVPNAKVCDATRLSRPHKSLSPAQSFPRLSFLPSP